MRVQQVREMGIVGSGGGRWYGGITHFGLGTTPGCWGSPRAMGTTLPTFPSPFTTALALPTPSLLLLMLLFLRNRLLLSLLLGWQ